MIYQLPRKQEPLKSTLICLLLLPNTFVGNIHLPRNLSGLESLIFVSGCATLRYFLKNEHVVMFLKVHAYFSS
jgi:hypothetical protein